MTTLSIDLTSTCQRIATQYNKIESDIANAVSYACMYHKIIVHSYISV